MNTATASVRDNLALLYQGVFTAAVRIQSGRQQIGNADAFRRRMRDALAEVSREAQKSYSRELTLEGDFAVVSFLDEVILISNDPSRSDWASRPLQEEMFGVTVAGELFFSRLESLLAKPDTPELGDVLEVFQLCLLLGFQGKYAVSAQRAELQLHADRIRQRLERIRGARQAFSPQAELPPDQAPVAVEDKLGKTLRLAAMVCGACAVLMFALLAGHLYWKSASLRDLLARSALL
jgi:type VI secretion system protein ImpK